MPLAPFTQSSYKGRFFIIYVKKKLFLSSNYVTYTILKHQAFGVHTNRLCSEFFGVFCFFVALSGSSPLIVALNTFIKQKPIFWLYVIISLFINGVLIAEMDYYED